MSKKVNIFPGLKHCPGCKTFKTIDSFSKNKTMCDGMNNRCRVCCSEYNKTYHLKNNQKRIDQMKKYRQNNYSKIKKIKKIYYDRVYRNSNKQRLAGNLRSRLRQAVKIGQKAGSAVRDLSCSIPELKQWLESQFYSHPETGEKMTWDNWARDGWHIDHIVPLCCFDLADRKQFLKANHWFNLRPLWAEENYSKIKDDLAIKEVLI